jgi:hypothetical protein
VFLEATSLNVGDGYLKQGKGAVRGGEENRVGSPPSPLRFKRVKIRRVADGPLPNYGVTWGG